MNEKRRMEERDHSRGREISRVTWVGFLANLALALFKIAAGYSGNSRAVLADGVHTLTDLATDAAVLVGVRFWMAPPDEHHPYGYKRLESLVSFAIGAVLAVAGLGIAWDALSGLGHRDESPSTGSFLALSAALVSVISKEILFRWTRAKARLVKSDALEANAWHHRSDALSSLPVLAAVALTMISPALAFADLVGAVIVAVFILYASWKIIVGAAHVLVDGGADPEVNGRIRDVVLGVQGVRGVHDLRARYVGQGLLLDMHVCVDANLSVLQGNAIAHCVEDALYSPEAVEAVGVEIFDVVVHIDPWLPHSNGVR